ncbi:MAG: heme-copper oxidase subunit III [Elusimicrobia bacterium]|nr:heme-copper oxidase subunit III [Elusimicrobiota bacterium]
MNEHALSSETVTGIPNGKLGIWVFLASEVMLFGGFISSYVVLRTGSDFFPIPARELLGVPLATLNTFVLITSSVTMVLALDAIQKGNRKGLIQFLTWTIILGFCFLAIKSYEYPHKWSEGITISSSLFGSFYFTLTGLHGLHVIGGIAFNLYILIQAIKGRYSADHCDRVEYAGLYWHFVDLVWVILFPIFYLL